MPNTKEAVKDNSNREMVISRVINAPREIVYELFTNPEHIKHWWGPTGFTNTIFKMDVKEGGIWDFVMHGPDGKDYRNTHVYLKLVKNEMIVMQYTTGPKFRMTVTFTAQGNKTLLNIKSLFESAEQLKEVITVFKADVGLKQNVDRLENYLKNLPSGRELVIMRQLNAPRKVVYKAWTDPESLAKWWGPRGMGIEVNKFELRPGGTFLYSMKMPDGNTMWGKFVYSEIAAPERLVFVSSFSDKDGNITQAPFNPDFPKEIRNTLLLTEHEGKTTLIMKGKPINASKEEMKAFEAMMDSMKEGFGGTFDQLEEYLAIK
jgi:uncharacterized protein YndB with AHSA1/START domain